jgi:pilus assembly protein CpaD
MRVKFGLLVIGSALAGCSYTPHDLPDRGVAAANVPVVAHEVYTFDAAAPTGVLAPSEAARLDGWFRSLNLGYGDTVYVDGDYSYAASEDVQRVAGQYGMLVSPGAPVTAGAVVPGTVRVVVTRTTASVPNCPNWSRQAQPNYNNQSMPNFGCAVNSNFAAMVANPEDLIHGRDASGVGDALTATKAIGAYRAAPPTSTQGLQEISTKKDKK